MAPFQLRFGSFFKLIRPCKHPDSPSRKTDGPVEKKKVEEGGPCCIALDPGGWRRGGEVNVPHISWRYQQRHDFNSLSCMHVIKMSRFSFYLMSAPPPAFFFFFFFKRIPDTLGTAHMVPVTETYVDD